MTRFRHGLFIGKFYPPHLGHHAVIRTAAQRCDRVTVVVMASVAETIELADRVAWLRAEHADSPSVRIVGVRCDAPLDVDDDQVWTAQVAVMRAAVRAGEQVAGWAGASSPAADPVDVVFSADDYGPELAERFGAQFIKSERTGLSGTDGLSGTAALSATAALSGTSARHDLAAAWAALAPATQAGMTTRIVLVGAESTGTTTVSNALTEHYRQRGGVWVNTKYVPEYGREYTETKWATAKLAAHRENRPEPELDAIVWDADDFDRVAHAQTAAEERAARAGSPLLVCDTDAFATSVWERRYLGAEARIGPDWSRSPLLPPRHLYLLTDHEGVPWLDDGLREGDLAIRAAMTDWFADALTVAGHSWVLLTGSLPDRIALAVRTVDQLLAYRMTFGAPLSGPGFTST